MEDLPIVVVTNDRAEAHKIDALNREVFAELVDPTDVEELKERIAGSARVKTIFARTRNRPIYGFKIGKETGIYHPYNW